MSAKRCQCCHRYAPKGKDSGEPVGECRGHAAIEEARDWARMWKSRAMEAGWSYPDPQIGTRPINLGNVPREEIGGDVEELAAAIEEEARPKESKPAMSKKLNAETLTNDEKLHAKWLEEGKELAYCQGPRRHFFIVGSPMWEKLVEAGCWHCGALPEVPGAKD